MIYLLGFLIGVIVVLMSLGTCMLIVCYGLNQSPSSLFSEWFSWGKDTKTLKIPYKTLYAWCDVCVRMESSPGVYVHKSGQLHAQKILDNSYLVLTAAEAYDIVHGGRLRKQCVEDRFNSTFRKIRIEIV